MVPCPWARDAAAQYRGEDVGVHLTLNAEWETYRWGPITHSPSLLDGDGGFPRTIEDTWDHADLDEVRRECRAQIERAILWGFDVSHLDSHMGTLQLRARVLRRLPRARGRLRAPAADGLGAAASSIVGFPYRALAADEGVVFPDHFVLYTGVGARRHVERALFDLRPGVTEVYLHPAVDTDELRASHPDWAGRVEDHAFLCARPVAPRPRRAGRRDAHRLPRAARAPARRLSPDAGSPDAGSPDAGAWLPRRRRPERLRRRTLGAAVRLVSSRSASSETTPRPTTGRGGTSSGRCPASRSGPSTDVDPYRRGAAGLEHLAFRATSPADVDAVHEVLQRAGFEVREPPRRTAVRATPTGTTRSGSRIPTASTSKSCTGASSRTWTRRHSQSFLRRGDARRATHRRRPRGVLLRSRLRGDRRQSGRRGVRRQGVPRVRREDGLAARSSRSLRSGDVGVWGAGSSWT